MLKRFIFTIVLMLLSVVLVSANGVDDQGNPNDPDTNDRANACFEGGDMEGKCDTPWEWMCGWHVIRLDPQNEASRAAFPPDCVSLLPEYIEYIAPVSAPSTPSANCLLRLPGIEMNFAGGYFIGSGGFQYYTTNCTGAPDPVSNNYVYAPAPFDALILCNLNGVFTSIYNRGGAYQNNIYRCIP